MIGVLMNLKDGYRKRDILETTNTKTITLFPIHFLIQKMKIPL